jgi:hypothetical protein
MRWRAMPTGLLFYYLKNGLTISINPVVNTSRLVLLNSEINLQHNVHNAASSPALLSSHNHRVQPLISIVLFSAIVLFPIVSAHQRYPRVIQVPASLSATASNAAKDDNHRPSISNMVSAASLFSTKPSTTKLGTDGGSENGPAVIKTPGWRCRRWYYRELVPVAAGKTAAYGNISNNNNKYPRELRLRGGCRWRDVGWRVPVLLCALSIWYQDAVKCGDKVVR